MGEFTIDRITGEVAYRGESYISMREALDYMRECEDWRRQYRFLCKLFKDEPTAPQRLPRRAISFTEVK